MAHFIELNTIKDERGILTVIDKVLPFDIKRVFYIYNATEARGGHRHKKAIQAFICVNGSCDMIIDNGKEEKTFALDSPEKCLLVEPEDWHVMDNFKDDAVLLVLSSEHFDPDDYITEKYEK